MASRYLQGEGEGTLYSEGGFLRTWSLDLLCIHFSHPLLNRPHYHHTLGQQIPSINPESYEEGPPFYSSTANPVFLSDFPHTCCILSQILQLWLLRCRDTD
ncbi:Hypothetical predicted protein [Podarcis lilfordi]|uniref:Uncharacterized protein n=1 Tax=Podarcis lilfordi TaxID=74358 RepID=A0AA35PTT1_9SAUR|nr:Hypothetical predicted protein [Podarcis lilfordi]